MGTQKQERYKRDEIRLGRLLVEKEYLTGDQLQQALREQTHRERLGLQSTKRTPTSICH